MTAIDGSQAKPLDNVKAVLPEQTNTVRLDSQAFSTVIGDAMQGYRLLAQNTSDPSIPEKRSTGSEDVIPDIQSNTEPVDRRERVRFDSDPRRLGDLIKQFELQISSPNVLFHSRTALAINKLVDLSLSVGTPAPRLINILLKSTKGTNDTSSLGIVNEHVLKPWKQATENAVIEAFEEIKQELKTQGSPQVDNLQIVDSSDLNAEQVERLGTIQTDDEFRTLRFVSNLPANLVQNLLERAETKLKPVAEQISQQLEAKVAQAKQQAPTKTRREMSTEEKKLADLAQVKPAFIQEVRQFFGIDSVNSVAPALGVSDSGMFAAASGPEVVQRLGSAGDTIGLVWASEQNMQTWDDVRTYSRTIQQPVTEFINKVSNVELNANASRHLPAGYTATRAELVLEVNGLMYTPATNALLQNEPGIRTNGIKFPLSEKLNGRKTLGVALGTELRKKTISPEHHSMDVKVRVHGSNAQGAETFQHVDALEYYGNRQQPFADGLAAYNAFAETSSSATGSDMLNAITRTRINTVDSEQAQTGETLYERIARLRFQLKQTDPQTGELLVPLADEDMAFIRGNSNVPARLGAATEYIFWNNIARWNDYENVDGLSIVNIDFQNFGALNAAHQAASLVHEVQPTQQGQDIAQTLATGEDAVTMAKDRFLDIYLENAERVVEPLVAQYANRGQSMPDYLTDFWNDIQQGKTSALVGGDEVILAFGNTTEYSRYLFQEIIVNTIDQARSEGIALRTGFVDVPKLPDATMEGLQERVRDRLNQSDITLNQLIKPHEANARLLMAALDSIPPHLRTGMLMEPIPPLSSIPYSQQGPVVPNLIPEIHGEAWQVINSDGNLARLSEVRQQTGERLQRALGVLRSDQASGPNTTETIQARNDLRLGVMIDNFPNMLSHANGGRSIEQFGNQLFDLVIDTYRALGGNPDQFNVPTLQQAVDMVSISLSQAPNFAELQFVEAAGTTVAENRQVLLGELSNIVPSLQQAQTYHQSLSDSVNRLVSPDNLQQWRAMAERGENPLAVFSLDGTLGAHMPSHLTDPAHLDPQVVSESGIVRASQFQARWIARHGHSQALPIAEIVEAAKTLQANGVSVAVIAEGEPALEREISIQLRQYGVENAQNIERFAGFKLATGQSAQELMQAKAEQRATYEQERVIEPDRFSAGRVEPAHNIVAVVSNSPGDLTGDPAKDHLLPNLSDIISASANDGSAAESDLSPGASTSEGLTRGAQIQNPDPDQSPSPQGKLSPGSNANTSFGTTPFGTLNPTGLNPNGIIGNNGSQAGQAGNGGRGNALTAVAAPGGDNPFSNNIPEAGAILPQIPNVVVPGGWQMPAPGELLNGVFIPDTAPAPEGASSPSISYTPNSEVGGVTIGGQLGSPGEAEKANTEMEQLLGKGSRQGVRPDLFPTPIDNRIPGYGEGVPPADVGSNDTSWGLPDEPITLPESEGFPEKDPVLDQILNPNGVGRPQFTFPPIKEGSRIPEVPAEAQAALTKALPELQGIRYAQFSQLSTADQQQIIPRTLAYQQLAPNDKTNISLIDYLDSRKTSEPQRQQLSRVDAAQTVQQAQLNTVEARTGLDSSTLDLINERIKGLQANTAQINQQTQSIQQSNAQRISALATQAQTDPVGVAFIKPEAPQSTPENRPEIKTPVSQNSAPIPRFMVVRTENGPKLIENLANGQSQLHAYPLSAETPITRQESNGTWSGVPDVGQIGSRLFLDLLFTNGALKMLNNGNPVQAPNSGTPQQPPVNSTPQAPTGIPQPGF